MESSHEILVTSKLNFNAVIFGGTATALTEKSSQIDSDERSAVAVSRRTVSENAVDGSFRIRHVPSVTAGIAAWNDCPVKNSEVALSAWANGRGCSRQVEASVRGLQRKSLDYAGESGTVSSDRQSGGIQSTNVQQTQAVSGWARWIDAVGSA